MVRLADGLHAPPAGGGMLPASGALQRLRTGKVMAKPKVKSTPQKLDEPRQVSPDLQARMDRFVRSLGHLVLVRTDPEAARRMAEDLG